MDIHEISQAFNEVMERFQEVHPDTEISSVSIEQNDTGIHVDIVPKLPQTIHVECTLNDNGMEVLMPKKEPRYSLEYLAESLSKDIPRLELQLGENYLTVFLPGNLKKRRHPVTIANRSCITQRVGIDWVTGKPERDTYMIPVKDFHEYNYVRLKDTIESLLKTAEEN